jgi:predicted nucleotidyltransferase
MPRIKGMDKQEALRKVQQYIEIIKKYFKLKLVVFYGSYTREEQYDESDIDIAVFIDQRPDKDYYKNVVTLFRLRKQVDLRIEPNLFYWDESGYEPASFENYIIQNGIIMYKA